jgi:hypothetical protein
MVFIISSVFVAILQLSLKLIFRIVYISQKALGAASQGIGRLLFGNQDLNSVDIFFGTHSLDCSYRLVDIPVAEFFQLAKLEKQGLEYGIGFPHINHLVVVRK